MTRNNWDHPDTRELIALALREDIGGGDVTTEQCVSRGRKASGRFYARQDVTLAGIELLPIIYELHGGGVDVEMLAASGDLVEDGRIVARVTGSARILLECERTALNFVQRLSGVATLARKYVDAVANTSCRVLDTRKTTPGFRRLEKLATAAAGVTNHRMALWDSVLIKNNHITAAGGIGPALACFKGSQLPVEIEVRSHEELVEALEAGARHVLLDNFTPKKAAEEVRFIAGRAKVELSGNIDLNTIRAYAETGADFVSCGAMTHQAQAVNFNFRIDLD
ncbi:MAG TPA: carboxylating nicotinate-nucleotide diphosphorylase, partial [Bryobacteraceae bacterium]|nr:carboxylating nicotinate-nucleotide diphosphorylase [Bryobacteraceae bacterium]